MTPTVAGGLSPRQRLCKRTFDLVAASAGLLLVWPVILVAALCARADTGASGLFRQERVGRYGRVFRVVKIRTMRVSTDVTTTVTAAGDVRITRLGAFFRRYKIDELPQLINVFKGEMSFVGPRPDVPGFADALDGDDRTLFLSVRPGITGPATLKYRYEEQLLAQQPNPEHYNREVIFPDKVRITLHYIRHWRFVSDLGYIAATLLPARSRSA